MNENRISAAIILYNPKINRLKTNIDAISPQVDTIYCFNNGSDNINEIVELINDYDNAELIDNRENLGISFALNRMAERSIASGHSWMLALDQDSICTSNMIYEFTKYLDQDNVAIICPFAVDKRRPKENIPSEPYTEVNDTITSGSLMNLEIYKKLGGSDEYLFIGLVDDEYCFRLTLNNYKIIRINSVILDHELGDLTPSKLAKFWLELGESINSKRIMALSYHRKVNPMRVYYGTRNKIYLQKKYRNYMDNSLWTTKRIIYDGLSNFFRGGVRLGILKAFFKGIKDGKAKQVVPYTTVKD